MSPRSIATAFVLVLLTSGLAPFGTGHPGDVVGEENVPDELPAALDPACGRATGTCGGAEESLGDLDETGAPGTEPGHHDVEPTAERAQHVAADHLVPGACADVGQTCGKVERAASRAVLLTSPAAHAGARPGSPVAIEWDAEVIDHAQTGEVFRVQARLLAEGGEWTDVDGYACSQSAAQAFPAGSCRATWTPQDEGPYALRVAYLAGPVDDLLCLESTCDLVSPFHVDATPPQVSAPCVLVSGACSDPKAPLSSTTLTLSAHGADGQGITRLHARAVSSQGAVTCVLHEGEPVTLVEPQTLSCALDVAGILPSPLPGVSSGFVDVSVFARDAAGNTASVEGIRHEVNTGSDAVAVTTFSTQPFRHQQSGKSVTLSFKVVYGSPASHAGLPVAGEPITVKRDDVTLCSGTTSGSGFFDCTVTGPDGDGAFVAGVTPRAGLASAPRHFVLTWTNLVVTRVAAVDLPLPTLAANPGVVYSAGYRVAFSHNNAPVVGAVLVLTPPAGEASIEATGASGVALAPVLSPVTAHVVFTSRASHSGISAAGASVGVVWTRVVLRDLALDDDFVSVGDAVTLTGRAVYEHDGMPVGSAALALAPGVTGCELLEGGIASGLLRARVRCAEVRTAPVPLVIASGARGITALVGDLSMAAVWTRVSVSGAALDRAFVNAGEAVGFTATATYVHDGTPVVSGALGLAVEAPGGCAVSESVIVAGEVSLTLRCPGVLDASAEGLPLALAQSHRGVLALAEPVSAKAVWTAIAVSGLSLDRGFVEAGDAVTLTGQARYAHDATLAAPDAALRADTLPSGCALLDGAIQGGALSAQIRCDRVLDLSAAGIPLSIVPEGQTITALAAPLALKAIWTEVRVGALVLADDFLDAGASTTFKAPAAYAHDGSPVPSGSIALSPDAPEDCVLEGDVQAGWLAGALRCDEVHDFRAQPLAILLTAADRDVTRLAGPVELRGVWTRIAVSEASLDDAFLDAGRDAILTARATYAHDGTAVAEGAVGLASALPGCSVSSGTILDGALRAAVSCAVVVDASAEGIPLAVVASDKGVVTLAEPLAARAIWTKVAVSYDLDTDAATLGSDAPVVVSATLTFAHDGSPVVSGVASVRGEDGEESQCLTDAQGACAVEVSRTLGRHRFDVTGFSTTLKDGLLVPDVTAVVAAPAGFQKRWTAIAFLPFECRVGQAPATPCADAVYPKGTQVTVTVRAVAADDATEVLGGSTIRLDAQQRTTDAEGAASKLVTRTSAGALHVTARGLSALIGGQEITATVVRVESIGFE